MGKKKMHHGAHACVYFTSKSKKCQPANKRGVLLFTSNERLSGRFEAFSFSIFVN
jgi:hypothetical protein